MWPNQAAQEAYLTDMLHAYIETAMWSQGEESCPGKMQTRTTPITGAFVAECPICHEVCAYWDNDDLDEDGNLPCNGVVRLDEFDVDDDLDDAAVQTMRADCEAFMKAEWAFVCDLDPAQVGGDFWLTRNGHGTGFWDRGHPDWLGRHLTDAAKAYSSADLYMGDDGRIYHS
jgi:hypothetical protein